MLVGPDTLTNGMITLMQCHEARSAVQGVLCSKMGYPDKGEIGSFTLMQCHEAPTATQCQKVGTHVCHKV